VYRSSSKIRKSIITMLRRKLYGSRSLEKMKLSMVGISLLVIASIAQCIGATGKFLFYVEELIFIFSSYDSPQNERKRERRPLKYFLEVIVKHVNFVVNSFVFRSAPNSEEFQVNALLHSRNRKTTSPPFRVTRLHSRSHRFHSSVRNLSRYLCLASLKNYDE
jgi:hypothetical protein